MHPILGNTAAIKTIIPRRRRRHSGCRSGANFGVFDVGRRAAAAACFLKGGSCTAKSAADRFNVNPSYVSIARRLTDGDRGRLLRGELKFSDVLRGYRRELAARRSQRLVEYATQVGTVDDVLMVVELDELMERVVDRHTAERVLEELELVLQRSGHDFGQLLAHACGRESLMAAVDTITAPQRAAAE